MADKGQEQTGADAPELDYEMALAAGIHDLRNRINHLLGAIETLRREVGGRPDTAEPIDRIAGIGAGISHELNAILRLYQVSRPDWKPMLEPSRLSILVEDAVAAMAATAQERGIRLSADTAVDGVRELEPQLVGQVLRAALDNALRFASKQVSVSIRNRGAGIAIEIEDDGPGFPKGAGRAINTGKSQTGMGLVFAEAVARALRKNGSPASIAMDAAPGLGGARFALILG